MDKKTAISLVIPIIIIIILVFISYRIPFKYGLSKEEQEILNFTQKRLYIRDKRMDEYVKVKGPFDLVNLKTANKRDKDITSSGVSLIVISGKKKMAIINNRIVKEGDTIDDKKIARILPDRVLITGSSRRWIYLKQEK